MRFALGMALNAAAFLLLALGQPVAAVPMYAVSLALLALSRPRRQQPAQQQEERRPPSPREIRERPPSVPV